MFLCHVTCNVWLGQIYPDDILLLHALLCHIWQGHGIRPESAGSEDQVQVQVELYCHSATCGDIQWNEMSCLTGPGGGSMFQEVGVCMGFQRGTG